MKISDYDYHLPEDRIARHPAARREEARLLRIRRSTEEFGHHRVSNLPELLRSGDLLVMNNTRVFPARLLGVRPPDNGGIEALLLQPEGVGLWRAMVRPGKKIRVGDRLVFKKGELEAEVEAYGPQGGGERLLRFHWTGDWWECLEKHGHTPLPPYILKARKHLEADRAAAELPEEPGDRERYQTVYAGSDRGSVAAPTAGLHFSDELLERLEQRGIRRVFLNLRVGAGTFQPVKTEDVESHPMHEEYFEIPEETARAVNQAKSEGRRIVAVGTTVVRALETAALPMRGEGGGPGLTDVFRGEKPEFAAADGVARALSGWTRLLIAPGFPFRLVDALVTNFHLPRSTLLLLVSALADREKILSAYENAVENEYRFYSYGDCSLIED